MILDLIHPKLTEISLMCRVFYILSPYLILPQLFFETDFFLPF